MVDVTSQTLNRDMATSDSDFSDAGSAYSVSIARADTATLAAYRLFCTDKILGPAQHPIWVEAWAEHVNPDFVLVTLNREGRPFCMVPLEIVTQGRFRVARYPGGTHANGNFPPASDDANPISAAEFTTLLATLKQERPDIDLLTLERNNPEFDQGAHPLRDLATRASPNVSLAADLRDGFDALLDRMNGKRKRRKYKTHQRKFDEMGGYQINEARSAPEVDRVLEQFFIIKARRFTKAGIPNVFAEPSIQRFFRALFVNALESEDHPFVIDALEIDGQIKAVNGVSITKRSAVCEFGAICDDNNRISPGFFLDYHHMSKYADAGKCFYDFSVGDEDYKRSWCEVETWQFDCLAALSLKGKLLRSYNIARARAIAWVKSSERLLPLVKRIRGWLVRSGR